MERSIRIAAIGDIHVREHMNGSYSNLFGRISAQADVLLLCGDLTNRGLPGEAHVLAEELTSCKIPVIAVLGNHDFESGRQEEVTEILTKSRIVILNGESHQMKGVGFAGVKGFAGGFNQFMLGSWGEQAIKSFVHEAVNESLGLETAIKSIKSSLKVVLMHYSPIRDTVVGETPEIYPFLGSSRLEEPINLHNVSVVFHGHAHNGVLEGKTSKNVVVYNVAFPLLLKNFPDKPYRLVELKLPAPLYPNGESGGQRSYDTDRYPQG